MARLILISYLLFSMFSAIFPKKVLKVLSSSILLILQFSEDVSAEKSLKHGKFKGLNEHRWI